MKRKIQVSGLIFLDLLVVYLSYIIAIWIRFDFELSAGFYKFYANLKDKLMIPILIIYVICFAFFKVYTFMITHIGIGDIFRVFLASSVATGVVILYADFINPDMSNYLLPRAVYIMALLLIFLFTSLFRASYKLVKSFQYRFFSGTDSRNRKRVLIYGAGEGGVSLYKALENEDQRKDDKYVVAFYDDDISKDKRRIYGKRVYGQKDNLVELCGKLEVDEIIIAIPSASTEQMHEIVNKCKRTHCKLLKLPNIMELVDYDNITSSKIQEVSVTDLLGRKEIELDIENICGYLENHTVLVTGGGGSIGSELCRQIIKYNPAKLIIFDIYENNAYDINNELINKYKYMNSEAVIGSVRDKVRLEEVFEKYKPTVVFHAAAHKHVPLMEASPKEAIKNNVFGTYNVAKTADEFKCKKFVLISTDKAVNPTNIMGATKRIAEKIIMSMNTVSDTDYVAVRFGNVLGSNGSVIPLFKKQIEEGGPVTVTDPNIIRYFMTIPEAARLVIQAGSMAKGGEIFILDMGEPVKILSLAEDLIKLSGYTPYKDIDIVFTGLRPGEKLYEELMQSEEGTTESSKEGIFVAKPTNITYTEMIHMLNSLQEAVENGMNIAESIMKFVPTYKPDTCQFDTEDVGGY